MREHAPRQSEDVHQLVLVEFTSANAEEYFALVDENREHFANFNNMDPAKYADVAEVRLELAKPSSKKRFGMYNEVGLLIGMIHLTPDPSQPGHAEVGYVVGAAYSGKGYATAATQALIGRAQRLGYTHLDAYTHKDNLSSHKVLQKSGFSAIAPENADIPTNDITFGRALNK